MSADDRYLKRDELFSRLSDSLKEIGQEFSAMNFEQLTMEYTRVADRLNKESSGNLFVLLEIKRRVTEAVFLAAIMKKQSKQTVTEYFNHLTDLGFSNVRSEVVHLLMYYRRMSTARDKKASDAARKAVTDMRNRLLDENKHNKSYIALCDKFIKDSSE